MNPSSGTQLSFLTDTHQDRPRIASPRMASNVLLRLLDQAGMAAPASTTPAPAVTFLRTIFPWAVIAAERTSGLPVTKTTLGPFLENPMRAIILLPPRPEEIEQVEALLEFVQRRLAIPEQQTQIAAATVELMGPRTSELLITPDSIPSPLFAAARSEAGNLFTPLLGTDEPEAIEYLVEARTQKQVIAVTGYLPSNPGVAGMLTAEEKKNLHLDDLDAYQQRIYFWEDVPRRDKYNQIWNEVKAAQ